MVRKLKNIFWEPVCGVPCVSRISPANWDSICLCLRQLISHPVYDTFCSRDCPPVQSRRLLPPAGVFAFRRSWPASTAAVPQVPDLSPQIGRTYLFPPLSSGGALAVRPLLRFHIPLIEPDVQISRIRLGDGAYLEVVRPSAQRAVQLLHQLCGVSPRLRSGR
jgi:hypothetical protein